MRFEVVVLTPAISDCQHHALTLRVDIGTTDYLVVNLIEADLNVWSRCNLHDAWVDFPRAKACGHHLLHLYISGIRLLMTRLHRQRCRCGCEHSDADY